MSIRFQCPSCQKTLNVPEQYAGRSSKCPGCSARIKVPAQTGGGNDDNPFGFTSSGGALVASVGGRAVDYQASDDDGKSDPIEVLRLRSAHGWQSVAGGLNNVWLGTGLMVLAVSTIFLIVLVVGATGSRFAAVVGEGTDSQATAGKASAAIYFAGMACVVILVLIGAILRLVGLIRCLSVPSDSGAKFLAVATLLCELFLPPLNLVCQLLFLRQIGLALGSRQLPKRVVNYAIWFAGGLVAMLLVFGCGGGMLFVGGAASVLGFFLLVFGTMIISLTLLIRYLGTLAIASDEIKKRTGKSWV